MGAQPLRFLSAATLIIVSFAIAACFKKSTERDLPRPPMAQRPVRLGVLPQLKAALDYLWRVETSQPEEVDNLPALSHALATFYGFVDPEESLEDMYAFLGRLCKKRSGKASECNVLDKAMGTARRYLLEDLIYVTKAYLRMGFRDAGSRSLQGLLASFESHRGQLAARLSALRARWPARALPLVDQCQLKAVKGMVVEATPSGVWVNGMAVLAFEHGRLPSAKEAIEGLQTLLVAGAAFGRPGSESRKSTRTTGDPVGPGPPASGSSPPFSARPFVVRLSVELPIGTVKDLLRLAAEVGLTRVVLRVRRRGTMEVLCLLPLKVNRSPVRPQGLMARIGGREVRVGAEGGSYSRHRLDRAADLDKLKAALENSSAVSSVGKSGLQDVVRVWEMMAAVQREKTAVLWLGFGPHAATGGAATSESPPPR